MKSKIILLAAVLFTACSEKPVNVSLKEELLLKCQDTLLKVLNDPKSYQFVSFEVLDTVTYGENIKEFIRKDSSTLEFRKGLSSSDTSELNKLEKQLEHYRNYSVSNADSLKQTCAYVGLLKFRATNAMNAIMLFEMLCYYDAIQQNQIFALVNDAKMIPKYPGGFPDGFFLK